MAWWQLVTVGAVCVVLAFALHAFLNHFTRHRSVFVGLFGCIALFCVGFALRFAGAPALVDTGFFLTDAASLFATVLFTAALILGQERYWES